MKTATVTKEVLYKVTIKGFEKDTVCHCVAYSIEEALQLVKENSSTKFALQDAHFKSVEVVTYKPLISTNFLAKPGR